MGGDLRPERRRIEAIDALDRRLRRAEPGPERVDARPDRRHDADPGDEDPTMRPVVHLRRFAICGSADSPTPMATASAIALNAASVREAMGRVKAASMNAAHGPIRGRKSWSISTRAPLPRGEIRHVTSMPFVAPPRWTNRRRSVDSSLHVRARHATGTDRPRTGTSGRRATIWAT